MFHLAMGLGVLLHVAALMIRSLQPAGRLPRISVPVGNLGLLVLCQIGLGVATWVLKYGWPSWFAELPFAAHHTIQANSLLQAMITTLHMAVGALILAYAVVIAMRVWLFFRIGEVMQRVQGWRPMSLEAAS
jgi:hypothetical protein